VLPTHCLFIFRQLFADMPNLHLFIGLIFLDAVLRVQSLAKQQLFKQTPSVNGVSVERALNCDMNSTDRRKLLCCCLSCSRLYVSVQRTNVRLQYIVSLSLY